MKKITTFLLVLVMGLFTACHDEIWNAIDDLDSRVTDLEELCKEMNTNIEALQTLVDVLYSNDYITSVNKVMMDGEEVGYTITFANHNPITIYHGEKGSKGKAGATPVVSVKKHTDGVYYWTVDGEWLKDEDGNMISVTKSDGITPLLKIETGYWYVSYDAGSTWQMLGPAEGDDGNKGDKGDQGDKGDKGDAMFLSVTEDADYVYFTLADGTVIKVAKNIGGGETPEGLKDAYTLTYDANGGNGTMAEETIPCGINAEIKACAYTLTGYKFDSWNTKADGTGAKYQVGTTIAVVKDMVLYAQWKEKPLGEFSISDTKKVAFSLGNLQYHPKNDTWRFAEKQTDYIGADNQYLAADYDGWIDLFGWSGSTGSAKFGVSTSTTDAGYYGDFVDWGTNQIGEDAPNTWRTLTYDEWYYLINSRPDASTKMGVAQVDGVNGLFLLPDNWECPSDITFKIGFHSDYGKDYFALHQTFTADEWMLMEAAGAIFLPAAGYRYETSVGLIQEFSCYWSATEYDSDEAHYLFFYADEAKISYDYRYYGISVRLVKDL
jgi:hypothetical protein